jgi:hypothetical protein
MVDVVSRSVAARAVHGICNGLGTTGYVAALKYFTGMSLEPLVEAMVGKAAGTAPVPGLQTRLGDIVVAGGTFLVIQAGAKKTESIDATDANADGAE